MARRLYKMRILLIILLFINNAFAFNPPFDSNAVKASFILNYTTENDFSADIILNNQSSSPLKDWSLGFTFQRLVDSISGARIQKQIGDYFIVSGDQSNKDIPPHSSVRFTLQGQYTIRNKDDVPTGYFLTVKNFLGQESDPVSIPNQFIIPKKEFFSSQEEYLLNIKKDNTSIEGNPLSPTVPYNSSIVVPLPVQITLGKGEFILKDNTQIIIAGENTDILNTANYLVDTLKNPTGYTLSILKADMTHFKDNAIYLILTTLPELGNEGYTLTVNPQNIVIRAQKSAGLFYGLQTLRQLLPPTIFNSTPQKNIIWKIPSVDIKDYPRFSYRGALLDVARHFFTVDEVKRFLDLMAMHKLNVFHWHLTDDEGWRIEIKHFPALTEKGAFRGYHELLPPALGSGLNRNGGFYTQDQIRDIIHYAEIRHITIIPEIDMPGHARALVQSLPELLIDPEDSTHYTSVRGFHDNVLSPCLKNTYTVVNQILSEIVALFPSDTIHIGSDERPAGAWEKSPACIALMKKEGLKDTHALQNYFTKKVQTFLASKQRRIGAWEEVMEGGDLLTERLPLIYAWLGINNDISAVKQGYDVVLSPYQYLYLELAYKNNAFEAGEYWGGVIDTFRVYSYSPPDLGPHLKGIEGGIWTEYIDTLKKLDYITYPKLVALAEVAWSPAKIRNWRNFSSRLGFLHLPRLDQYGVFYRISPPGLLIQSQKLLANDEFPGLKLRYTLNGELPNTTSSLYLAPLTYTNALSKIIMSAFDTRNRQSQESMIKKD